MEPDDAHEGLMQTGSRRTAATAAMGATALVAIWSAGSQAALPPQYDRWNEFAAVVSDNAIAQKLGVYSPAERIERVGDLSYRVYGGQCFVPVTLARRAPTGPQGQVIIGGSVVSIAEVGAARCG
jgi:hypothetical protein